MTGDSPRPAAAQLQSPRSPGSPNGLSLEGLGLSTHSDAPISPSLSRSRVLSDKADEAHELLQRSVSLRQAYSSAPHASAEHDGGPRSLGRLLASRLADLGVTHFFGVPGDFNLSLLDEMLSEPRLRMVSCCNELNAGYACDGYARARGLGAFVTTFAVGGLSALNAVAGAYAESHPVVAIVGAPYSTAWALPRVIHHTLGEAGNLDFELRCYAAVTCHQAQLRATDAPPDMLAKLDAALQAAVEHRKPVYISVPSNYAALRHPAFAPEPVPLLLPAPRPSVPEALEAAAAAVAAFLNRAAKPVLVVGAHMRSPRARAAMIQLADRSGMPVATMVNSKGLFPEDHPNFIGLFWSSLSSPGTGEIVVSADAYLFAGPVFHDLSTAGFTHMIAPGSMVDVQRGSVRLGTSAYFGRVLMEDLLEALAPRLKRKSAALDKYRQQYIPPGVPTALPTGAPLLVNRIYKHLQQVLTDEHALLCDVGDGLFYAAKLRLPGGAAFEVQSLYASIGWSVGAALGYGLGCRQRRVVCLVGDGAMQMTVQELSSILRYGVNPIVLVTNNGSYTIESEIHDGPYNVLQRWDFGMVARGMAGADAGARLKTYRVDTEEGVAAALREAVRLADRTVLIECMADPSDCSVEVLTLGRLMQNINTAS